jgi:hypothetical protein
LNGVYIGEGFRELRVNIERGANPSENARENSLPEFQNGIILKQIQAAKSMTAPHRNGNPVESAFPLTFIAR